MTQLPSSAPHLRGTFSRKEKGRAAIFALASLAITSFPALAVEPDEMLANPALESRARELSAGLRCLVCQNQSVDDSDAALAHDLRVLVRERLTAGDSNGQVRDFLVARYGPYILLRPPLSAATLLLWSVPLLCFVIGGGALFAATRRRAVPSATAPLDATEQAALERLTTPR